MIYVNILNSTLKVYPEYRRALYDLESLIVESIETREVKKLDMDINLSVNSPIYS